ncbi:MAG TPA: EAL domain-containing protein [Thiohalobacter sp.]|nr:EAL domain-containing protein [Thiohalobacter sp.]
MARKAPAGAAPSGPCGILLRICDENGQEVAPMAFIPAAERYNMMPEVDRWVIARVLDTAATIGRGALREVIWTINISGRSLGEDGFLRYLLRRIADSPVPASRFCFEITETAAIADLRRATHLNAGADGLRYASPILQVLESCVGWVEALAP